MEEEDRRVIGARGKDNQRTQSSFNPADIKEAHRDWINNQGAHVGLIQVLGKYDLFS